MDVTGSVALVTGANHGIGRRYAEELLARGASKVYAAARRPDSVDIPGAIPIMLDITDPASVAAAAAAAPDVTLLVNNAGTSTYTNLVEGDLGKIRQEMDTHLFGTLDVVRAFAPVLATNGGGAIVNMLSALSWFSYDGANAYSVAKAAQWSMTNGIRLELAGQNILVVGVHVGAVDTDLMAGVDVPKTDPRDVARAALDAVAAGRLEVLVDDDSRAVKAALAGDPGDFYGVQLSAR